jgi:hypothetical protein
MVEELDQLFCDIESHLRTKPDKRDKFALLVQSLRQKSEPPSEIFVNLLGLVDDNPLLLSALHQSFLYFENPNQLLQASSDILHAVRDTPSFPSISRCIALFVQGWISFDICKNLFLRHCPHPSAEFLAHCDRIGHFFSLELGARRLNSAFSGLNDRLSSRLAIQLLVVLGFVPNPASVAKALAHLQFFAFGIVSYGGCLSAIDPILGTAFTEVGEAADSDISDYFPTQVFDQLIEWISEPQAKWVFGDALFAVLARLPKIAGKNAIQQMNCAVRPTASRTGPRR